MTRYGLWLVLALALLVRLVPMFCERQVGRDVIEYQNLAENMHAGRGFTLDIKAYWATPTPVVHYGLYERPVLLPVLLALLRTVAPPLSASQLIGPLLFLLTLALIYQTLFRTIGPGAAFSAGVLLALQPTLFGLSLMPLSETTTMMAMALIVWAFYASRSAVFTGLACSVAFLARPSMLLVTVILGVVYLIRAVRSRRPAPLLQFSAFALVGPFWLVWFNHANGAPLLLLPQSFLFRVMNFQDQLHYFHQGPLYASTSALLKAQGDEAARLVSLNGFHYAQAFVSSAGLGLLVAFIPLAVAGLCQAPPLRRYLWLVLFALADLILYTASWATFDAGRFLAIPYLLLITLIAIGTHEVLDREPLFKHRGAWCSAATCAFLAVALVWLGMDGWSGYVSYHEWRIGEPRSSQIKMLWRAPGVSELTAALGKLSKSLPPAAPKPIVATNEPWMIYDKTGLPAAKIPYDLRGREWLNHIAQAGASLVVIHLGDWPEQYDENLAELFKELTLGGWSPWYNSGQIQAWRRPLKSPAPARTLDGIKPAAAGESQTQAPSPLAQSVS